jgi:predicted nucleic acid-binding protein
MYPAFWQQAGRLKAEVRRISLADCLGLVLAATVGAEFVTADRHEMEALAARYGYQIMFIR